MPDEGELQCDLFDKGGSFPMLTVAGDTIGGDFRGWMDVILSM